MSKKKTNGQGHKKFAKLRKLLGKSNAAAPVQVDYLIRLEGNFRSDTPPSVVCDCGWRAGPSENLLQLSVAAKRHETYNPGHYRRQLQSPLA